MRCCDSRRSGSSTNSRVVDAEQFEVKSTHAGGIEHGLCRLQRSSDWRMVIAQAKFDAATQKKRFDEPDVALDWSRDVLPVLICCLAKVGLGEEDIPKRILQASDGD